MTFHPARRLLLGLTVAVALVASGCGSDTADTAAEPTGGDLSVTDAWVRATTGTEDPTMTAAFMAIANGTDEDVRLVGASSPGIEMVQVHEMVDGDDGHMVMQEAPEGVTIRAGKEQLLMPGGYHVMLMGLTEELAAGAEVALTLEFSDGTTVDVTAPVKEYTEEEEHYHTHDGASDGASDHADMSDEGSDHAHDEESDHSHDE